MQQLEKNSLPRLLLICRVFLLLTLTGLYLFALKALLHPRVSDAYRYHFIEKISGDFNPTKYHLSPDETIALSTTGLPDFVDHDFGFSYPETWGRWTDANFGNRAGFVFNKPYTGPKCLVAKLAPSDSMQGRSLILSFGDESKTVSFGQRDAAMYFFDFPDPRPAGSLQFQFMGKVPSAGNDPRQLGLAIHSIRVITGSCEAARSYSTN